MIETNKDKLVKMALNTTVSHPRTKGYWAGYDGKSRITMGPGGITYSHAIGDSCMDVEGDHVEPGVSMANKNDGENAAVQHYACIGNPVKIVSGPAKGNIGYVTGTHGGVDHTMAYFEPEVLEEMVGNEMFLIKACGLGLKLKNHPDITMMNIDPELFDIIDVKEDGDQIFWPVAAVIPSFLMGSGIGASTILSGDYDIMTQDKEANEKYGINKLRLGDFIAIEDQDAAYGPHYKKGAITIGVIVHSDSFTSGHGPGVTVAATAKDGKIVPVIDENANLKNYLEILKNK